MMLAHALINSALLDEEIVAKHRLDIVIINAVLSLKAVDKLVTNEIAFKITAIVAPGKTASATAAAACVTNTESDTAPNVTATASVDELAAVVLVPLAAIAIILAKRSFAAVQSPSVAVATHAVRDT